MRARSFFFPSAVALLVFWSALCPTFSPAEARPRKIPQVLGDFEAGVVSYRLAVFPCAMTKEPMPMSECPIAVHLVEKGNVLDSQTLPVAAAALPFAPSRPDRRWPAAGTRVWSSGLEEASLDVAASVVLLGDGRTGFLVTETYGFSHLHRDHALYIVEEGRLKRAWAYSERASMDVSLAYPVTLEGRPHVLFWQENGPRWEDRKRSHQAALIGWDAAAGKITVTQVPILKNSLYVVIASEEDVGRNREAGTRGTCGGNPESWEQAARKGQVLASGALLGTLFFSHEEALEHQEVLKQCPSNVDSLLRILTLRDN